MARYHYLFDKHLNVLHCIIPWNVRVIRLLSIKSFCHHRKKAQHLFCQYNKWMLYSDPFSTFSWCFDCPPIVQHSYLCRKGNYGKSVMNKLIMRLDVFFVCLFLHQSDKHAFVLRPFGLCIFLSLERIQFWHIDVGIFLWRCSIICFIELFHNIFANFFLPSICHSTSYCWCKMKNWMFVFCFF